jgi:hypothetical protein
MENLSNRDLTMKVELPDPKLICPSLKPVLINA